MVPLFRAKLWGEGQCRKLQFQFKEGVKVGERGKERDWQCTDLERGLLSKQVSWADGNRPGDCKVQRRLSGLNGCAGWPSLGKTPRQICHSTLRDTKCNLFFKKIILLARISPAQEVTTFSSVMRSLNSLSSLFTPLWWSAAFLVS